MIPANTPTDMRSLCPLCRAGKMALVCNKPNQMIWSCSDCPCVMNVPAKAWDSGVEKARTIENRLAGSTRPVSAASSSTVLPTCPLCAGGMEVVYDHRNKTVRVCADCDTSISVAAAERGTDAKVVQAVSPGTGAS